VRAYSALNPSPLYHLSQREREFGVRRPRRRFISRPRSGRLRVARASGLGSTFNIYLSARPRWSRERSALLNEIIVVPPHAYDTRPQHRSSSDSRRRNARSLSVRTASGSDRIKRAHHINRVLILRIDEKFDVVPRSLDQAVVVGDPTPLLTGIIRRNVRTRVAWRPSFRAVQDDLDAGEVHAEIARQR